MLNKKLLDIYSLFLTDKTSAQNLINSINLAQHMEIKNGLLGGFSRKHEFRELVKYYYFNLIIDSSRNCEMPNELLNHNLCLPANRISAF